MLYQEQSKTMTSCAAILPRTTASFTQGRGDFSDQEKIWCCVETGLSMDRALARKRRLQFLPLCGAIPSNVRDKSAYAIGDTATQAARAVNRKPPRPQEARTGSLAQRHIPDHEMPTCMSQPRGIVQQRDEHHKAVDDAHWLRGLGNGSIMANRFMVVDEGAAFFPRRNSRFARDLDTGECVFLRFFPRQSAEFYHVAKMHELLKDSKAVCKLIEMLPSTEERPPCLVFEAGSYTLSEKLAEKPLSSAERRDLVHSIVQILRDLHESKVVHGQLDPAQLMWFSAESCWKLVSLHAAAIAGYPIPLCRIDSFRYAAPEIRSAVQQNKRLIRADTSLDMYAFGLIAFEILTGASVLEADGVWQYVARERRRLKEQWPEGDQQAGPADLSHQHRHPSFKQRWMELDFVMALLEERPAKRKTALQAVEEAKFEMPTEAQDPAKTLYEFFSGHVTADDNVRRLGKCLVCHVAFSRLDFSLSAVRLAPECNPDVTLCERRTRKAKKFFDESLPTDPVHVIRTGETFGIRISLGRDSQFRFPLEDIVSVRVIPPDGDGQAVEFRQEKGENFLDGLAFVDPSTFTSSKLNKKCPIFGSAENKYVKLTIHVTLRLGNDFPYDIDVYPRIYLQLKRPRRQLGFFKMLCR